MKNYEKQLIVKSLAPDIFSALLIFAYAVFSTRLTIEQIQPMMSLVLTMIVFMQFICAPVTDHLCYKKISDRIERFYLDKSSFNVESRTKLFEDLMQYPTYTALMTLMYFFIGVFTLLLFSIFNVMIPKSSIIIFFTEATFGIMFATLVGYNASYNVTRPIATDIVKEGIETTYALRKKTFGLNRDAKLILTIVIPIIFTTIINCSLVIVENLNRNIVPSPEFIDSQKSKVFLTCILNIITLFCCVFYFYKNLKNQNDAMSTVLNEMSTEDISKISFINTDLSDEGAYNQYLSNQLIIKFGNVLDQMSAFGFTIKKAVTDLGRIANETETTSIEQSTGIKEIVSTMENATKLSHDIENRIMEVAQLAKETVENVNNGSNNLERTLDSISSIDISNKITIKGIKDLTERINSIWEIANIIDNISNQTKIIAFNAELEATGTQKKTKNFKNVSVEIRRLANKTMDSTREIKTKINEIQNTSLDLLKTSKKTTTLINHGNELSIKLEDKFTNISNSAKSNSISANEIQYLVQQQTKAFDQIVSTLQQISMNIQHFSLSTRTLIETSKKLQTNVEILEETQSLSKEKKSGREDA